MNVRLTNPQIAVEMVIRSLQNDNKRLARSQLSAIKKNAYNKLYYAQAKFETTMPTGIDYQVQQAQIRQARIEYEQVKNAVNEIRNYMNNPEDYTFKNDRKAYYKVQRAFQRINYIEEKKKAEKEVVAQAQKEAGTVVGVTLGTIRKSQKMRALFENVLYNNSQYGFKEKELNEVAAKIKEITGYDVLEDLSTHFDTPQHYESGGTGIQTSFFDKITEISQKLKGALTAYKDNDKLDELEKQVNKFLTMARQG